MRGTESRDGPLKVGNWGRSSIDDNWVGGGVDLALLVSDMYMDCKFKDPEPALFRIFNDVREPTSRTVGGSSAYPEVLSEVFKGLGLRLRFGDGVPALGGSQETCGGRVRSGVRDDGTRLTAPE